MKKLFLFLIASIMMIACSKKETNPFLIEWDTPYGLPPFNKIEEKHYLPALEAGIQEQEAEIEAIVNDTAAPTFENTIAAYEKSGALLNKVSLVLFNLSESDASESLQKLMEQVLPMISEHSDNIFMNVKLFNRVDAIYNQQDKLNLTIEQKMVLDKMHRRFIRNGIGLDAQKQARLREINKQLSALEQKFGNNLLAETNAFQLIIDKEADLAGLPEAVRTAAAEAAKEAGMEGKWLFGLQKPSWVPFMQYSERRDLREKMFKAYAMRGNNDNANDNKKIVLDIMKLRIEKANMMGFDTPANFILDETMAKNSKTVNEFLAKIFAR